MSDVFFYEAFEEEAEALRRCLGTGVTAGFTQKTIQEQADAAPPAALISIRTQSKIPPAWAAQLGGILTRSTGYDHVRAYLQAAGRDIPCGYLPKYCARAVAEQAALFWMALLRKLPRQLRQFTDFHRDGVTGWECEHKTLLVVGVGTIGIEVVRVGRGLGMEVLGVDIVRRHTSVPYVEIEDGLARADVVVCSMNLTPANQGYFNRERFHRFKPGAVFINIARGEMSPARDLLAAVDEGRLGGVGLDVYENESALAVALRAGQPPDDAAALATLELAARPNVLLTPHNAFNTVESVGRKAEQSVEQIRHFLENQRFVWPLPE